MSLHVITVSQTKLDTFFVTVERVTAFIFIPGMLIGHGNRAIYVTGPGSSQDFPLTDLNYVPPALNFQFHLTQTNLNVSISKINYFRCIGTKDNIEKMVFEIEMQIRSLYQRILDEMFSSPVYHSPNIHINRIY